MLCRAMILLLYIRRYCYADAIADAADIADYCHYLLPLIRHYADIIDIDMLFAY